MRGPPPYCNLLRPAATQAHNLPLTCVKPGNRPQFHRGDSRVASSECLGRLKP